MPKIQGLIKTGETLDAFGLGPTNLQPGWKTTDDGYGLQTLQATFIKDSTDGSYNPSRGLVFPIEGYQDFNLHKWSITNDGLKLSKYICEYVSINPTCNDSEGEYTNPQVSMSNGLATENITAHPNFFVRATGFMEGPIAGTSYAESDFGPTVVKSDGTKGKSYIGANGACFERQTGGRFIGFVDPQFRDVYGKTNYLTPTTQFSGIMYFEMNNEYVQVFRKMVGRSSNGRNWIGQLPDILPAYIGDEFVAPNGNYQLLMSQVNYEDFGNLVKVSYEIRYSKEGWPQLVYPTANDPVNP